MIRKLALALSLVFGASAAQAQDAGLQEANYLTASPELYVVMFRADWCPPCKVVEPAIDTALRSLSDPSIEYVEIDISHPSLSELSAHRAFDRDIVAQYNRWLGLTGFAAIVDATNKQTLGCVNMMYDAQSMATHIRNLKTYAVADQSSFDLTCPEPNNPVG